MPAVTTPTTKVTTRTTKVLGACVASLAVALTGCSPTHPSSSSSPGLGGSLTAAPSASPPAAATPDYSRLLVDPDELTTSGDSYAAQAPTPNPGGTNGTAVLFTNRDDTRAIGDTVLVFPNPPAAKASLDGAVATLSKSVSGGTPQPFPVGTGGTAMTGSSPDGSKAVTVLLFTQGSSLVRLEFDGAPGEPTPSQLVTDVAQKQNIAVRTGLAVPQPAAPPASG